MESLKEFLSQQAQKLRAEKSQASEKRDEWVEALGRLNQRIKGWLAQADPDHQVLDIHDHLYPIREEGIGTYEAPGLSIRLGTREIRVEPIARHVAGPHSATGVVHVSRAYGRVDLTDGLSKFMIFRVEKDPEDRWNIIEQDNYRLRNFDQASFEEAFKSLLE